ncbi:hypothetical protein JTE90_022158 [Oedothorax gibbosus]|uniref:Protein sleepless n=1 Tax=Oedothorax gibbosus TaxID=931172 RepID=A0AAV6VSN8_9ARAC|nr:hypothetical protein JTE90_022158 [Oedothorax gibbosus]
MNLCYAVVLFSCLILALVQKSSAIYCYQCNSNEETYCSELFNREGLVIEPTVCDGIYEAKFCIKATGMYEGTIGTRRFCSSRNHGNTCEYVRRPGDEREYRSCIYTCSSDGCNGASTISKSLFPILGSFLSIILLLLFK